MVTLVRSLEVVRQPPPTMAALLGVNNHEKITTCQERGSSLGVFFSHDERLEHRYGHCTTLCQRENANTTSVVA